MDGKTFRLQEIIAIKKAVGQRIEFEIKRKNDYEQNERKK